MMNTFKDWRNKEMAETLLKEWIECYIEMNKRKLWTSKSMKPFEEWTSEDKHICNRMPEIRKTLARMGYTIDNVDTIPDNKTIEDFNKYYLKESEPKRFYGLC